MVFWILFIGGQLVVRWPGRPRAQELCSTALLLHHHLQRREDAGISSPPGSLNLSRAVGVATGGSYPAWGNSQNLRGGAGTASGLCLGGATGLSVQPHSTPSQLSPLSQTASSPPHLASSASGSVCRGGSAFPALSPLLE